MRLLIIYYLNYIFIFLKLINYYTFFKDTQHKVDEREKNIFNARIPLLIYKNSFNRQSGTIQLRRLGENKKVEGFLFFLFLI